MFDNLNQISHLKNYLSNKRKKALLNSTPIILSLIPSTILTQMFFYFNNLANLSLNTNFSSSYAGYKTISLMCISFALLTTPFTVVPFMIQFLALLRNKLEDNNLILIQKNDNPLLDIKFYQHSEIFLNLLLSTSIHYKSPELFNLPSIKKFQQAFLYNHCVLKQTTFIDCPQVIQEKINENSKFINQTLVNVLSTIHHHKFVNSEEFKALLEDITLEEKFLLRKQIEDEHILVNQQNEQAMKASQEKEQIRINELESEFNQQANQTLLAENDAKHHQALKKKVLSL